MIKIQQNNFDFGSDINLVIKLKKFENNEN